MKVLVTGGSGFIGTHLLGKLINSAHISLVINVDLNDSQSDFSSHGKYRFLKHDIRNIINRREDIDSVDCIIHLAALCKEPGYPWRDYFSTNFEGTKNIIDLAKKLECNHIIFTSTMMVFKAGEYRRSEHDMVDADTAYGSSKALAEESLIGWQKGGRDNRLTIIRPGVVYGSGENGNYTNLIRSIKNRKFAFIGRRDTIKGSVYVKDCVNLIDFALRRDDSFKIYHAVYQSDMKISEICRNICEAIDAPYPKITIPYTLGLAVGYAGEFMSALGVKTPLHHRRFQKLYNSTDLANEIAPQDGFVFEFTPKNSLTDWLAEDRNIIK